MGVAHVTKVPGPRGLPIVGNVFDLDFEAPLESILTLAKDARYQEAFALTFAGQKDIYVTSAAISREISDETRFTKLVHSTLRNLRPAVGSGLFTAFHGEADWAIAHRILMPVFGPIKIRDMFHQMEDLAIQLCLKWARHGSDASVNVTDDFTRLTLDTIGLCAMGCRFNSFYDGTALHPFVESMLAVLVEADTQAVYPDFVNSWRRSAARDFRRHVDIIRSTGASLVKKRREQPVSTPDLLNAMLHGRDPKTGQGMSDESIIDNMGTFLIAGHETTSGMLSFAFYYMLKDPKIMKRAQGEIDQVIGGGRVTVDHLGNLPYITAILRETLRLQPTAPAYTVTAQKDEIVGGRFKVDAGEPIVALLHAIHRDPSVYGSDADVFRPERMLDGCFEQLPPGAWKPFGNGTRGCIGRAFAWQEALLTIAMILQNFDVSMADPDYVLKTKEALTVKPDGFNVRAKLRRHAEALELAAFLGGKDVQKKPSPKGAFESRPLAKEATSSSGSRPLAIFYGSNTGTCAALAERLMRQSQALGFQVDPLRSLDGAAGHIPHDRTVIIFTASYDGQPADAAGEFVSWLQSLDAAHEPLKGVNYSVFGCGHRDWPHTLYRIPKLVDQSMREAGATRVVDSYFADSATGDLVSIMEDWAGTTLWPALGLDLDASNEGGVLTSTEAPIQISMPQRLDARFTGKATVRGVRALTSPDAVVQKVHMDLEVAGRHPYSPGSHVNIIPLNPVETVGRALRRFSLSWDSIISISGDTKLGHFKAMGAGELLQSHVELSELATPKDVRVLASLSQSKQTRDILSSRAEGENYHTSIRATRTSILDLLEQFDDLPLPFYTFVSMVPSLRPRTYSISSAQVTTGLQDVSSMSLTISVLQQPALSCPQQTFFGVGSTYLARRTPGDVFYVQVKEARSNFCLPDSAAVPVVMIAAGSGYAPFRGFLQELSSRRPPQRRVGDVRLFLGCRGPSDDIYRDELDAAERDGVVCVVRAYSRHHEPNTVHGHVQEALNHHEEELVRLWQASAKFFVCGSTALASDVKKLVMNIAKKATLIQGQKLDDGHTDSWFAQFEGHRYVAEVFT